MLGDGADTSTAILERKAGALDLDSAPAARQDRTPDDNVTLPTHSSAESLVHGSLRDAIRQHPTQRLWVPSVAWIGLHLDILNVRFKARKSKSRRRANWKTDASNGLDECRQSGDNNTIDAIEHGHSHPRNENSSRAADSLQVVDEDKQFSIMSEILEVCGFSSDCFSSNWIGLDYDGKRAQHLWVNLLFTEQNEINLLAYIHLATLQRMREIYIHKSNPLNVKRRKIPTPNEPVAEIRKKKLNRIKPAVETEDPQIASTLIALAQEQQRRRRELGETAGARYTSSPERVFAIAFPVTPAPVMYFYEATIPYEFLQRLERPRETMACAGFTISYRSISLTVPMKALMRLCKRFTSE
ncbi:hypothetical protein ED733_000603 [Metarhizium rileyi]|uniref:Uncharacterized protein n=1 Tax=Metarhizium rileyi (strain RCEF 4871) TaxID=1649241 RepID=A0A5C6G5W7_METRR|nr:hypothetical protein ED733_000603 [Metarhizium rileyi]